jgi:phage shock protein A
MSTIWERLRRLITLRFRRERGPLQALDERQERLLEGTERLAQQCLKLGKVQRELSLRAESLRRLAQRYDDLARKHYKLGQIGLAEAAIRERLKHQAELERLNRTVEELGQQLETLKAHKERLIGQLQLYRIRKEALELRYTASQAELEARELQLGLSLEELPDLRETIRQAEEEIRAIQARLEATEELAAEPQQGVESDLADEEVAREIARLRDELKGSRR